jgi:hypothetical protein
MDVVAGEAVAVLKSLGYIWKLDLEILTMTVLVSLPPASHARSVDHQFSGCRLRESPPCVPGRLRTGRRG